MINAKLKNRAEENLSNILDTPTILKKYTRKKSVDSALFITFFLQDFGFEKDDIKSMKCKDSSTKQSVTAGKLSIYQTYNLEIIGLERPLEITVIKEFESTPKASLHEKMSEPVFSVRNLSYRSRFGSKYKDITKLSDILPYIK